MITKAEAMTLRWQKIAREENANKPVEQPSWEVMEERRLEKEKLEREWEPEERKKAVYRIYKDLAIKRKEERIKKREVEVLEKKQKKKQKRDAWLQMKQKVLKEKVEKEKLERTKKTKKQIKEGRIRRMKIR